MKKMFLEMEMVTPDEVLEIEDKLTDNGCKYVTEHSEAITGQYHAYFESVAIYGEMLPELEEFGSDESILGYGHLKEEYEKTYRQARHIATAMRYDGCWERLAEEFQNLDLDSFVARAKVIAPAIFYDKPETGDVEGEVQSENENYILTWEDAMDETMRIYEK